MIRHLSDKMWFAEVRAEKACLAMIAGYRRENVAVTPTHDALLSHASVLPLAPPAQNIGTTAPPDVWPVLRLVGRELWLQYRAECVRDGGKGCDAVGQGAVAGMGG